MNALITSFSDALHSVPVSDIPLYVLSVAIVVAFGLLWSIRSRQKLLLPGNVSSIEETLADLKKRVNDIEQFNKQLETYLKTVEMRIQKSAQAIETVRFNPFKGNGSGSNQSFATAMLSEKGDGVIISSLYSRERVSVYAKPLKNFTSTFELSEEEQQAISLAEQSLTSKIKKS